MGEVAGASDGPLATPVDARAVVAMVGVAVKVKAAGKETVMAAAVPEVV